MIDPSSMRIWLPHVERLGIPSPRTILIPEPEPEFLNRMLIAAVDAMEGGPDAPDDLAASFLGNVKEATDALGYPVFLRTDLCSAKHDWQHTCFVWRRTQVASHVLALIEFGMNADMIGLQHTAIAAREYLHLDAPFAAYRGLPIAAERRYFVRDGEVLCHHPYWERDAVAAGYPRCAEWEWHLERLNREDEDEVALLAGFAAAVGAALGGFWSIDFARDAARNWWLIDMAVGAKSWHPATQCAAAAFCAPAAPHPGGNNDVEART